MVCLLWKKVFSVIDQFMYCRDDPRMYTLVGIRRRGVPPEAINSFVLELGVTTAKSTIDVLRFDSKVRDYLDKTAPRTMVVMDPIKVTIENLPDDYLEWVQVPNMPRKPEFGEYKLPFTNTFYIDSSDFREVDSKDYYRLAPGKSVGLLHVPRPVKCVQVKKDANGKVTELVCHYENEGEFKKPKTYIHWVGEAPAHGSPVKLDEVRLYEPLFKHSNPDDAEGGFLNDINPDSLQVVKGALATVGIYSQIEDWVKKTEGQNKESMRWQFVRTGYFCLDYDTELDVAKVVAGNTKDAISRLVVNRTVTLREDAGKSS